MASSWISKKARKAIYERDNFICCYCGKACEANGKSHSDAITLDHIVPQEELYQASSSYAEFQARRKDPKNLVCACFNCNSSKREMPLYVWAAKTGKDYVAIIAEISRRIAK